MQSYIYIGVCMCMFIYIYPAFEEKNSCCKFYTMNAEAFIGHFCRLLKL